MYFHDDGAETLRGNIGNVRLVPTPMKPRAVKCPQCGSEVPWTPESKWRPFCSERCKLIDLGAWASERYRIATPEGMETPPDTPGEES
jgi:uncharacterized protein